MFYEFRITIEFYYRSDAGISSWSTSGPRKTNDRRLPPSQLLLHLKLILQQLFLFGLLGAKGNGVHCRSHFFSFLHLFSITHLTPWNLRTSLQNDLHERSLTNFALTALQELGISSHLAFGRGRPLRSTIY